MGLSVLVRALHPDLIKATRPCSAAQPADIVQAPRWPGLGVTESSHHAFFCCAAAAGSVSCWVWSGHAACNVVRDSPTWRAESTSCRRARARTPASQPVGPRAVSPAGVAPTSSPTNDVVFLEWTRLPIQCGSAWWVGLVVDVVRRRHGGAERMDAGGSGSGLWGLTRLSLLLLLLLLLAVRPRSTRRAARRSAPRRLALSSSRSLLLPNRTWVAWRRAGV